MNILSFFCSNVSDHPAACVFKNGKLIAFAEEERFIRVKMAHGYFPSNAVKFCLEKANLTLNNINCIAYGWDCKLYYYRFPLFLISNFVKTLFNKNQKIKIAKKESIGNAALGGLESILSYHPAKIKEKMILGFNEAGLRYKRLPKIYYVNHHLAHAASAFYCSGFKESAVLVFDGHGEKNTISIYKGEEKSIKKIKEINIPNSLGWFYSIFTEFLGWNPNEGEVKLMGLAPYGKYDKKIFNVINDVLKIKDTGIVLNSDYTFYKNRSYGKFFSDLLVAKLGLPRNNREPITDFHRNIAYAVQTKLEEAGIYLAKLSLSLSGSKNLCISGGVALNCKLNGEIYKAGIAKNIFVQPLAYDAGTALGAGMYVSMRKKIDCRFQMEHLYYGPEYFNEDIKKILKLTKVKYKKLKNIEKKAAELISKGNLIGWFQGPMEAGPRALGGRSILADPRRKAVKDKINDLVKFRENWRPFALSIQEEYLKNYVKNPVKAPFMIMAFDIKEKVKKQLISGIHEADNTTRPQTVSLKYHPKYWKLIDEFGKLTGVRAVLNTSFNVKGEPIVCSPSDALRCFFGTGLDYLIIGDYLVEK